MQSIYWLDDELCFPPADYALSEPNGLLCAGGDLSPHRLVLAYHSGIFPWYEEGQPILWWSPDPRCIIQPENLHISRSMKRTLRKGEFKVTIDQAFAEVIEGCAEPRPYTDGTWITDEMKDAYIHLHELKVAHSFEVWKDRKLVGGLYGISLGRCFFGESMFSRVTNASKVAFIFYVKQMHEWGMQLLDCQIDNPHLLSMGANTIPRSEFLSILRANVDKKVKLPWQPTLQEFI